MKYLLSLGIVLLFFSPFFTGCEEIRSYPATPEISYSSFYVRDTVLNDNQLRVGTLAFTFVDGDGDFGLMKPDSGETDTSKLYNLYFTIYNKINGTFVQDTDLRTKPYYPVYYHEAMQREGQDKTLKGTIAINIEYFIINYDTVKYDFFIVDRALNKSNVASTPDLELRPEPVTP